MTHTQGWPKLRAMETDGLNLIEQRVALRGVIDMLAGPLTGEARKQFLRDADARLNRHYPAPGAAQKRASFRIVE